MERFSIKRVLSVFLVIAMIMTSLGLQDETVYAASRAVKSVSLKIGSKKVTKKTFKMTKGKSKKLKVSVKPASSRKSVTYQSTNKKVVTVSGKGKLKAKKAGTAKIIVKVKGKNGVSKKTWVKIKVAKKKTAKDKDDSDVSNNDSNENNNSNGSNGSSENNNSGNNVVNGNIGDNNNNAGNNDVVDTNGSEENNNTSNNASNGNISFSGGGSSGGGGGSSDSDVKYTVTFNSNGGSTVTAQAIEAGSLAKKPENPIREGYVFDDWYTAADGGQKFDFNTAITGDITLYAHWSEKIGTYTVTFDSNGGSMVTAQAVEKGNLAVQPENPSREGYIFDGWYTAASNGEKFDFNTAITGNITLYAHWSENVGTYTVTFDSNGGSMVTAQAVEKGNLAVQPENPSREGYVFDGWYTAASDGEKFDFNTAITGDIILYAHWNVVELGTGTYRITFDTNDGSADVYQVQRQDAGETVDKPNDPARDLYRFTGWYMEPAAVTEYNFDTPVVSDLTLYAGWGNPDGSDGDLYAASNETETIYSITDINVVDDNVTVTYNTNSQCLMTVEFFEDQMSESDWSEDDQESNLELAPVATASGYTEDYGELINVTLPINGTLPEHFVARAALIGTGEEEDPDYVSFQYTATYEEFEEQTVDSVIAEYGEEQVINFDDDRTTNFGVLNDSVKVITRDHFVGSFEVTDIETEEEDNVVPDHKFIFRNADNKIKNLQAGDVIYLEGTTWMFKIGTIEEKENGTVVLTKDKEAVMTDFYDVLQVEMEGSDTDNNINSVNEENGIAPIWEIIDVDANLSGEIGPFGIEKEFQNGVKLSGSLKGKATGNVKMSYDAHLFSADYFESSVSFTTEISGVIKAEVSRNNDHEWKNVVYQVIQGRFHFLRQLQA